MLECPSCGDPYERGASFCQYCGYLLARMSVPETNSDGSITICACPNRDLNRREARFCQFCGNSLVVIVPERLEKDWRSILALEKDENIIDQWSGSEKEIQSRNNEHVYANERGEGLLVLTDRRLMWLHKLPSGEGQHSVGLKVPLEKISGVSAGTNPVPYVAVNDNRGFHVFSLLTRRDSSSSKYMTEEEFSSFRETIMKYRAERKSKLLDIQRKERVQVILDFRFLKDYMEKGGMTVQKISCANCGASMRLPEKGNTVECSYCRTNHRVEDIYDRIKQLVGS